MKHYLQPKDYRFQTAQEYTKITREDWDAAKANLISRGMLNKAGAITVDGRNAVADLWDFQSLGFSKY